jgi:hypothetical protein
MLIAIGVLITLLGSIGMAKLASSIFKGMREPHNFLYENKTLAEVRNMSTIVRPLVDRDQKFDIVATVWVRRPDPRDNASWYWGHGEEHIFSDTVFHGVTLMDEHVHTQVNLSIPLETLYVVSIMIPCLSAKSLKLLLALKPKHWKTSISEQPSKSSLSHPPCSTTSQVSRAGFPLPSYSPISPQKAMLEN